jgi:hypothetical protein
VIKRRCWEEVNGFPEIVSEDLAFAIRIREKGYRGKFVKEVICYEDFPDNIRAFRIRHMKWTRGNCEFLSKESGRLIRSRNISTSEKLDILFPTLNLPLTLFYFLFMIDANIVFPTLFGHYRPLTIELGQHHLILPTYALDQQFSSILTKDFFAITLITFFSPILCFIISLGKKPLQLFKFLCHSTTVYASLSTLSALGVLSYVATRKATFLVTGDTKQNMQQDLVLKRAGVSLGLSKRVRNFLAFTHPDQKAVQAIEICVALLLAITGLLLFQISFLGLCLAFILLPVLHNIKWGQNIFIRTIVFLPFIIIILGLLLTTLNLFGIATIFFGYGFHF